MVKKVLNVLREICIIAGVVLVFLGALMGAMIDGGGEPAICVELNNIALTVIYGNTIAILVGLFLLHSKNDVAKRIGHGLLLAGMLLVGVVAIAAMSWTGDVPADQDLVLPMSVTFGMVGAIVFAVNYIFVLILWIIDRVNHDNGLDENLDPETDPRFIKIKQWKALQEEGIITAEEYEEKRLAVLGLKKKETKVEKR